MGQICQACHRKITESSCRYNRQRGLHTEFLYCEQNVSENGRIRLLFEYILRYTSGCQKEQTEAGGRYCIRGNYMQEKEPQYINSIMRATAILELYEKMNVQYLGIAEISKELKLQKTTTFNIVKTLMHQGWLVQDNPNGKYKLGTRILRVATMITRNITTEDLVVQEMHRLRDKYNEDAVLTAMVDGVPICVEKVQSANFLQIQSKVGRVGNLVKGSTGKTLLAWQPEKFIQETLEHSFSETESGRREREEVEAQLEVIRSQGFCISISEQDEGVASVSVPILDGNGYAAYSLAVIGEEKRMRQKGLDTIRQDLMETANRLSEEHRYIWG